MRELARIQRIIDLVSELWSYDSTIPLGELLEKWIWSDWIQSSGDIFRPEDTTTEQRLKEAIIKAKSSSMSSQELSALQKSIINKIAELWPAVPDQRFGQFLSNYAFGHFMDHPPKMLLRQTDETVLQALEQYTRVQSENKASGN